MADRKIIVIDAGHGGTDPGAVYYGRREKDDALNLALAVGDLLADHDVEVVYARVDDTYQTPFEKAAIANRTGADYLISIHRNAMPTPNTASGAETLVFENSGMPAVLAENINAALEKTGFANLGVVERPGLAVLRRAEMPAVLIEVGFLDNEADNQFFDRNFREIAEAIAGGVMTAIEQEDLSEPEYYQIQVAAYRMRPLAEQLLTQLQSQGFPAYLVYEDGFYKVRAGAFLNLDNAVQLEKELRTYGYNTFITKKS